MKTETWEKKINSAIENTEEDGVRANFTMYDSSIVKSLRVLCVYRVQLAYNELQIPVATNCAAAIADRNDCIRYAAQVRRAAILFEERSNLEIDASSRTKSGQEKRAQEYEKFYKRKAKLFLSDLKKALGKRRIAKAKKEIAELQEKQKVLIDRIKEETRKAFAARKEEIKKQKAANEEALKSGRFWEADTGSLKTFFHPPFEKNCLVDVSERWRAALFAECKSSGYKSYNGWRHKLVGTGRYYLCGIDDNGQEWGNQVQSMQYRDYDEYGDIAISGTVPGIMEILFDLPREYDIDTGYRQGDILFIPSSLEPGYHWNWDTNDSFQVRGSHVISSIGLQKHDHIIFSEHDIFVTHTDHKYLILPAGQYKYFLTVDPD
jgi:hypothetical protein